MTSIKTNNALGKNIARYFSGKESMNTKSSFKSVRKREIFY